ncbi:YgiQ family radical SAM protein [Psychrosphaera sp. F3M07]|uniref:YgiQ family radical SAM protein n=1 Tax=Psychrosphaera sp. F3M07 TaxID=2841560 RepID=UPI001C081987|nr:YgiQ family radical SAM protein [Psychrosphaera sp. F3M07]MBU2916761.1 YgiQ family radical SAM protein [Psychrosphaera sp. F3M07]
MQSQLSALSKSNKPPQATVVSDKKLWDYPKYWAECFGPAPFLPTTREEMDQLGWDSCDVIIVTGDAYVDHPSFGMAVIGRMLESQGFRVGIIDQPDWHSKNDFQKLGKPNLYFGVAAGNMDSMINRYTADRKLRHDDAYTPDNIGGKRPDRAVTVYSQRCREAYKGVPIIIGGIEASLRRISHYDYWSDKVRRSVLVDSKADMLVFGNAERPLVEVTHRIARGEDIKNIKDVRGTAIMVKNALEDWQGIDSTHIDKPGIIDPIMNPYQEYDANTCSNKDQAIEDSAVDASANQTGGQAIVVQPYNRVKDKTQLRRPWDRVYVKLPAYEVVSKNQTLYAHTNRILHQETNPGCAKALMQRHGDRSIWINPPAFPLETEEMDFVFGMPYARVPHPKYDGKKIPAYDMIKTSVNIMRGCYGGCTFCSITEHEGRIIQSRSEDSIINEIEQIRDVVPGFTGVISDLGGPTANMYMLRCQSAKAEATCRRASCVYPDICKHMDTDHEPTIKLYQRARELKGIKKILIASGVRYDLAIQDPRYVKELVTHHVGGYLKIAPEHTEEGPLSKMMKPGMGSYHKFKELFEKYSKEAGKEQYLIPYFIAAHPGTTTKDMINLALWLKENKFRLDQVQNFYPSPMATATTMYHTEIDTLHKVKKTNSTVAIPRGEKERRLHKAILRYHDSKNWKMIRHALKEMGLAKLIGHGVSHLVPPASENEERLGNRRNGPQGKGQRALSRHTGLGQFKPGVKSDKKPKSNTTSNNSSNKNSTGAGVKKTGNKPGNRSRIR